MNKLQNNTFSMLTSIEHHFNQHLNVWNTNIPITHNKEQLSNYIINIKKASSFQLINNRGVTDTKKTIRIQLETVAYKIIAAASAYATFNNKSDLFLRVNYTKTHLKKLRDTELQSIATNLVTNVLPVITDLAPYGITPYTLETLTETINLFAVNINKPKEATETKKETTTQIAELLKKASVLLKTQLDLLVVGLETTDRDFVVLYTSLRRTRKPNRTKLALTTVVLDASTLLPIVGAQLKLLESNIKRISSAKGINRIKHVSEGRHEVKVSHKDYLEVGVKFITVKGITKNLIIKLEGLT